jgi:hypothetical protein
MTAPRPMVTDRIICTACHAEARASEGYPCHECGGFLCVLCSMRGVIRCRSCEPVAPARPVPAGPRIRGV